MPPKTLPFIPRRMFANLGMRWMDFPKIMCVLFAVSGSCSAQHATTPNPGKTNALPEVMVVPIKVEGRSLAEGGWILTFRNRLRGNEAPSKEVEQRTVTYQAGNQKRMQSQISWEIMRTPNMDCRDDAMAGCHDTIRILAVPSGFISVPQGGSVEEGSVLKILIVPAGIS